MDTWVVRVQYADGDDFTAGRYSTIVRVATDSQLEARLVAEQMVTAIRPDLHVQITGTSILGVLI